MAVMIYLTCFFISCWVSEKIIQRCLKYTPQPPGGWVLKKAVFKAKLLSYVVGALCILSAFKVYS
ncbi:MAG: hypothetical protein BGO07_00375 [Alphaproteobacteria bacterium 40-19]|nr:MAG: hypothetical protein BGO07_00375 [Alphaproteobacteria bacterium 40-19]